MSCYRGNIVVWTETPKRDTADLDNRRLLLWITFEGEGGVKNRGISCRHVEQAAEVSFLASRMQIMKGIIWSGIIVGFFVLIRLQGVKLLTTVYAVYNESPYTRSLSHIQLNYFVLS